MNKPLFSLVVVGRDEEKTLPRLLGSLREFFDRGGEMVFVDTGSKDKTAQIARDAGCRVFEEGDRFRYVIDDEKAKAINEMFVVPPDKDIIHAGDSFFAFDQARNYAMNLASNDFICTPDCDEAWTVLNIDRINELIEQGYEKFLVDFVFAHHPDGSPSVAFSADTRFYDRRKIKWKGIIHETMQGEAKMTRITKDVAYLEHYQNMETDRTKYLAGLAWACYEEPDNDRNSHYFARELMYRGHYNSAIKEFHRHIDMGKWADERGQSMVYIGTCYDATGAPEKALEWWHRAFSLTGSRREPLIHLAYYWKRKDKPQMVAAYAAAALQIPNNGFYANRVANYTFEPHALMYWAKGWSGDILAARQHWFKCWEYHPDDPVFISDFDYYFKKPKVSIVIPSIRADKLERCLKAIEENAGYADYEVIVEKDSQEAPQGAPKVLKRGVERSTGELVMFLGDDTIPQKNFLFHAVASMHKNFPDLDGLIGLNDMYWKGEFATHWLASKKLLPYLGGEFFHTGYNHLSCDNELTEMCRKAGKYYWEERAKVYHDHPGVHGWSDETYDKHYRRVYQFDTMRKDRELLEKRSKLLGFQITNGLGCSAQYPDVPDVIDLRKRVTPNGKRALNVGVGPGDSWLAQQLPHMPFSHLDHIDVHKPYLDKAAEIPWAAENVGFIHKDITEFDVDGQYDIMLMFDVIEHLPKDKALEVLKSPVDKLIFVPLEDTDSLRVNRTGVESQDHVSCWTEEEIRGLGFETETITGFMHRKDGKVTDALWAWTI